MQSAERRRCNQRDLPAKPGARWRTGKEGSPVGRKPERLSPSGWKHCVQWKFCIPSRVLRQFCIPNSTLPRKQYSIPQRNLLRRCKIIVEKGCFKRKMGDISRRHVCRSGSAKKMFSEFKLVKSIPTEISVARIIAATALFFVTVSAAETAKTGTIAGAEQIHGKRKQHLFSDVH